MNCRFCNNKLNHIFVDLGNAPASNSFLSNIQLNEPEVFYPLKTFVCDKCFLVQIDEYKKSDEIFDENYAYFSSFSSLWLEHAKNYVSMIIKQLDLNSTSLVTEIASNDGYLLQNFKEYDIPCVGIEPTKSTAKVAKGKGITVIEDFFTNKLAKKIKKSDLIIGNNVLAHVPNIVDFIKGLKTNLKENGTITLEFPHLLKLIKENQFDTIYHEHYSYLSLYTVKKIFKSLKLKIYKVEELQTHGGSLRIYATHIENNKINEDLSVQNIIQNEINFGLTKINIYLNFQKNVNTIKNSLLEKLITLKNEGYKVVAYGAAAKGNTLLNYAGIKEDLITFVVDKSPHKQNKYLPASHIPILNEEEIIKYKPDFIMILPWNIKDEITKQLNYVKQWNCKFITAIPKLKVF